MSEIVNVWKVKMDNGDVGATLVQTDIDAIGEEARAFADDLRDGQSFTMTVTKGQMTQAEVDALPEFAGY